MEFVKDEGLPIHIKSWCADVEPTAMAQAENLARHPVLRHFVALMPDCHCGIGMPIGGVIAAKDAVIPSAVGVDIGCGMIAVETDIPAEKLEDMRFRRAIHTRIKELIPVGEGQMHKNSQEWDGFEKYLDTKGVDAQFITKLDRHNLGTLGGGNHFIEMRFRFCVADDPFRQPQSRKTHRRTLSGKGNETLQTLLYSASLQRSGVPSDTGGGWTQLSPGYELCLEICL